MFLKAIREFHARTKEQYRLEEEKDMEPWKKRIRNLHEQADFLFYYEECESREEKQAILLIKGDLVRGMPKIHSVIYLLNGEGKLLGQGSVLSEPEEKEEQRKGFLTPRRNEFLLKLTRGYGREMTEIDAKTYQRVLRGLERELCYLSDIPAPDFLQTK